VHQHGTLQAGQDSCAGLAMAAQHSRRLAQAARAGTGRTAVLTVCADGRTVRRLQAPGQLCWSDGGRSARQAVCQSGYRQDRCADSLGPSTGWQPGVVSVPAAMCLQKSAAAITSSAAVRTCTCMCSSALVLLQNGEEVVQGLPAPQRKHALNQSIKRPAY
jgi:hypothetical protein